MIGFLTGTVQTKNNEAVILLTQGVGYLVNVPSGTLSTVSLGQMLDLYIYTHVKEEALDLYGFKTQDELSLFKIVLGVSGIGPKTALAVVDKGVAQVKDALMKADSGFFLNVPRLGQKGAQRMIIELKNKIGAVADLNLGDQSSETVEVVEALQSMGYSKQESLKAIKGMPSAEGSLEQKITYALRQLGKRR